MARKPEKGVHGHAIGYQRGCELCEQKVREHRATPAATVARRRASADAQQRRDATRAGRLAGLSSSEGGKVVAMPTRTQNQPAAVTPGANEAAVIEQCAMSKLADAKPGIVSQARSLARILDTKELMTIWPRTSSQLQALLRELDGPRKKMAPRLATISTMAGRKAKAQ
ncbi:hypothetical protein BN000_02200 [Mycobacterium europaeum]|uniref:Uncharacterized protein n=1 Tax=Mycobacterium europaeum TaxID=761804 RepID=A0A0U1D979_9MYCO|nr:hypothetical protein [Mycobacterium europaeum]CQD10646.1 hypothetical protein BN000_02200 [Mycobacterium europaeum]